MVKKILTYCLFMMILATTFSSASAQKFDCFARVSITPREGVVRQPFRVEISVYTATWYTQPLQFNNLEISNAFILPFTQTLASTKYINRKKYSTLTFYYIVYPYTMGDMTIPELNITATTPAVDDYKGVPITIKTKEQRIKIINTPVSDDDHIWNVANNMTITEKWDKPLNKVKEGDVINRTVTINSSGTLPTFIEPLSIDSVEGVSIYDSEPRLIDKRSETQANGQRIEYYAYLFEKAGELEIPEQTVEWYNANTKKIYSRKLEAKDINVEENPNLQMLKSLQDSLAALRPQTVKAEEEEKEPTPWTKIIIFTCIGFLLLFMIYKVSLKLIKKSRKKREVYLSSPKYYSDRFHKAIKRSKRKDAIANLYTWLDRARKFSDEAYINAYLSEEEQLQFNVIQKSNDAKLTSSEKKFLTQVQKSIFMQLNPKPKTDVRLNP